MSNDCQKCGPNPQECPVVLCSPCALSESSTISISELEALHAAMSAGEFRYVEQTGRVEATNTTSALRLPKDICEMDICEMFVGNAFNNAHGIVAEHNAMPVLLEVVKAALAWQESRQDAETDYEVSVADGELADALAKVRP
jgi:hypothetical protein